MRDGDVVRRWPEGSEGRVVGDSMDSAAEVSGDGMMGIMLVACCI